MGVFGKHTHASVEPFLPEDQQIFIGLYDSSDDESVDHANADAVLEQMLLALDSATLGWADTYNGGMYETTTTGGIASVAQGDGATKHPTTTGYTELATDIVITMDIAWEDVAPDAQGERHVLPIVIYNGDPVPFSDISHMGDGKTASDLVIIVDNSGLDYGAAAPTASEWAVVLAGHFPWARGWDLGGLELPITSTKLPIMGVEGTVYERKTKDGASGRGTLTLQESRARMRVTTGFGGTAAEVLNWPGEEIEKILWGSNWAAGAQNFYDYLPTGKKLVIAIVKWNPDVTGSTRARLHPASAADYGKVFCVVKTHYGCELTAIGNEQGSTSGGNETIQTQFSVEWKSTSKQVILTAAA